MRASAAVLLVLTSLLAGSSAWALDPIPFVRTPDAQFANLPGYAFAPSYITVDGDLRMHYVDVGPADGHPILLLHGEPSWSYLYRKMITPLAAAGYRVIAPDLIGFGRSDKPTNRSDYTYTRHVNWVEELLLALDLQQITLFGQDWGGLIGLRLVASHPNRFSGVIAGNTALLGGPPVTIGPPSHPRPPGLTFAEWLDYSQTVPVFDTGFIVQWFSPSTWPAEVIDAYRAPFPNEDETYLAGAREFPVLVGTDLAESQAAWALLQTFSKPFLTAFSDGDSITWGNELRFIEHVPGAAGEPHVIIQDAGHFLQEDKGEELADLVLDFLSRNGPGPVPTTPCSDGVDNDGHGDIDLADPGCAFPNPSIALLHGVEDPACQDGQDNDGDGSIDFDGGLSIFGVAVADADANCGGAPYGSREAPACGVGFELALLLPLMARRRRVRATAT